MIDDTLGLEAGLISRSLRLVAIVVIAVKQLLEHLDKFIPFTRVIAVMELPHQVILIYLFTSSSPAYLIPIAPVDSPLARSGAQQPATPVC